MESKIVLKGIAEKISGSARKGKDGLVSLLAEKDVDSKARVTSQKNIQNAIVKYFEGNSIEK